MSQSPDRVRGRDAESELRQLEQHLGDLDALGETCLAGSPIEDFSDSFFGGLPTVDEGFVWPMKSGHPLHFVGQLKCSDLDLLPMNDGYLLFFYDNRHWGYSPKDLGHAVVMHQQGARQLGAADLPECRVTSFFGLLKRTVRPTTYERVNVSFEPGVSYPSSERLESFGDDGLEELYGEFCAEERHEIQIGGYPFPIQSDEMERDCVKAFDHGQPEDWRLLLQLFELGDMRWGDAGALYWFIHQDDLEVGRLDRVWMVTQCH